MALKETTQYKNYSEMMKPLAAAATNIGKTLPQKKSFDASKYSGLSSNVGMQSNIQAPSSGLGTITTPYGGSTKYEKFHPGVDIANKAGTKLPSFTGGTVTGVVAGTKQGDKGYGNYVIVTDAQGNQHRYSHLLDSYVKVGQPINKGAVIGSLGNTGQTYSVTGGDGSHLDYRVKDIYNKYINPYKFITK